MVGGWEGGGSYDQYLRLRDTVESAIIHDKIQKFISPQNMFVARMLHVSCAKTLVCLF